MKLVPAFPFTPNIAPTPRIVDIYHGDVVADFAAAKTAGLLGVIHKATTGETGQDARYKERRTTAAKAGLLWGAYHWGTAVPIDAQVANFLRWATPDDQTLIALDYEGSPGDQMTLAGARQFCEAVEAQLGRKLVIYSGNTLKSDLGDSIDPFFGARRLWLSEYGTTTPRMQASWSTCWLWQYTDGTPKYPGNNQVDGIPGNSDGELDCNFFAGSNDDLLAQWAT